MLSATLKKIAHGRLVDIYGCAEWDKITEYLDYLLIDKKDFESNEELLKAVVFNYKKLIII